MDLFLIFCFFALIVWIIFRKFFRRVNSKLPARSKSIIWLTFFLSILFTFLFTNFVENSFKNPDFDQTQFFQILPTVILAFGVISSILLPLLIYIFVSMKASAVAYANEVTKGLRQAKAKDEAMLESVGEGLVATGKDGNIVLVNRAFENLLGWKESEVQGKLFINLVSMQDENGKKIENPDRPIQKMLKNGNKNGGLAVRTMNAFYKRKNGSVFPVSITISPILVEGEVIGVVEVFRDITKEREIDKEKTEFVSLASHQLRTPLSTINWYTEMLLAGDAGKLTLNQKKYLEEIYAGNQRMVELVNSLLNVSRLELGTFTIDPEPTNMIELAKAVIKEQEPGITARKLYVETNFGQDVPEIYADPKLLRMVFQNLLSNAVKYTPESGHILVGVEHKDKEVLIKVSDSGWGIPKDEANKIFTKLFRASNVKEQDTEGTGLGLYIVKSIVEESGGTIRFESEEHKGTTFFVSLPLEGMKRKEGSRKLT